MAPSSLSKACLTRQSYLAGARQVLGRARAAGFEVDASGGRTAGSEARAAGPANFVAPSSGLNGSLGAGPKRYLGGAYDSYRRRLSR